jgi:flagellar basal-body rod modification protein FlgD
MATVPNVTGSSSSAAAAMKTAAPSSTEIQDRFLKLLVTQMKNQDPLNPLDNAQLTTQLAQISTVNGIQDLNSTMQSLSASLTASQSTQAASLIGRTVVTSGNSVFLKTGAEATAAVELAKPADSVKVIISGPAGDVVRQINLGAQGSGMIGFKWDGLRDNGVPAPSGNYTFQATAMSGGQKVDASPVTAGIVNSVTLNNDATLLSVDGVGDIQMNQIRNIM